MLSFCRIEREIQPVGEDRTYRIHFDALETKGEILSHDRIERIVRAELEACNAICQTAQWTSAHSPGIDRAIFTVRTARSEAELEANAKSIETSVSLYPSLVHARSTEDTREVLRRLKSETRSNEVVRAAHDWLCTWAKALVDDLTGSAVHMKAAENHTEGVLLRMVLDRIALIRAGWPGLN